MIYVSYLCCPERNEARAQTHTFIAGVCLCVSVWVSVSLFPSYNYKYCNTFISDCKMSEMIRSFVVWAQELCWPLGCPSLSLHSRCCSWASSGCWVPLQRCRVFTALQFKAAGGDCSCELVPWSKSEMNLKLQISTDVCSAGFQLHTRV